MQVRSPNLFHQYWKKPQATRDAFADGWFDTGDLGQVDDAGFLTLVGRKHDLIITAGFNVYPAVVERVVVRSISPKIEPSGKVFASCAPFRPLAGF